jgi:hypothetical protein
VKTEQPAAPACPVPQDRTDLQGKMIFFTDREKAPGEESDARWVYVMDADGKNQKPMAPGGLCAEQTYKYFQDNLAWSNGHKWLLTVDKMGSGTSIMLRDASGKLARRVTTLDGVNYDPAWAPDQVHIVFVSEVDTNDEIYTASVNDGETRRLTQNTWEWDKYPTWDVDGKYIVFWSNRETMRKQIWVMGSDGSLPHNISNSSSDDWDPIWVWP